MEETQDFKSLQDQIQAALVSTTRTAGEISSEDLSFQRSLNPELGTLLDEQSARLLELSTELLKSATSISDLRTPVLEDQDDVENNWRSVVDVLDSLLEKTDTSLDEYRGVLKHKETQFVEQEPSKFKKPALGNAFRTQNLLKPQLAFNVKPNNSDNSPWKPLLTAKPHAILPLEESLGTFSNDLDEIQYDYTGFLPLLILPPRASKPEGLSKSQRLNHNKRVERLKRMGSIRGRTDNIIRYRHPYETEILSLKYPSAVYQKADPIPYLPVETTSATFVDTFEGVLEMLKELKSAKEIAIDLEHHDVRSYVGLTSLMQISTREKDWIVDTLKPWRQDLQVLNEVFADPNILKVLHGAYMDIVWLQRDLGLYIVGLFDTHHASRTLGYAGGSLAFLLKKFIDFDADKKPIPEEMFFYARADTHFLLYIYDNMRNELIDRTKTGVPEENRIEMVLEKSKETSLLRYERQVYHADTGKGPGGWYTMIMKTPSLFNNEQFAVFRAVHRWRDEVARIDDDSTAFVLPQHALMSIAKLLPNDMMALLGIAHSHSVKSRATELLALIKKAKASGTDSPSMMDVLRPDSVGAVAKANIPSLAAKSAAVNTLIAVVDESQLRSDESSFWGGAFGSSIWDEPAAKSEDMRLAVPLPALSSEIFEASRFSTQANSGGLTDRSRPQTKTTTSSSSQPHTPQPKPEDEAFILKRGGKRKSEAVSESDEHTPNYDMSFYDSDGALREDDTREVRTRDTRIKKMKADKKARKAAERAKQTRLDGPARQEEYNGADVVGSGEDRLEDAPFDYSKADSVLHGKRKSGDREGGKKGKKPFDPYSKSENAPTGMRRVQTERAGKSHTFKS
ncbi:Ribosomal RNA-processing 6 [Hyphodiscus hymeniophilus]|uniref:Ribosomal RNA-processing 6 n=1 Tax=Hyphodiscus hymeniophilus TaxID=353542 RepID=A0A9P6VFX0_9HELO|nr:Ribosomal RNA-processing 6 [Hyphodiscus hymeniophilus]